MTAELGKIEKPSAEEFKGKRKLFLVPLLFTWEDAPAEYVEKFKVYWQQVEEHIANLESKIGRVCRIYHESISAGVEEGLKDVERLNQAAFQLLKNRCLAGAQLEATEDAELVAESMDWERHLLMGFISEKAARIVSDLYLQTSRERYQLIAQKIDETLKEDEAALVIIREGHLVQFPPDIEVFLVSPPALDEIHRWLRDRSAARQEDEAKAG